MAITNFIITVVGVGAAVMLLRSDVKQTASIFRRNARQIRQWLEEESVSASKNGERAAPKELDSPKHDKH